MDKAKLAANRKKLAARFGGNNKLGGKGSIRRKKKVTRKSTTQEDKNVLKQLKKLGGSTLEVEQVNLFKDSGEVIHYKRPKVQFNLGSNMFVISGKNATKKIEELLPEIVTQLGPEDIGNLKKMADHLQAQQGMAGMNLGGSGFSAAQEEDSDSDDDDDDIPDLVEDFETTAGN